MGLQATCMVSCPAGEGEAKALLESAEVLVRGPFRWRIPLAELKLIEVSDDRLRLGTASGITALSLGNVEAEKWAEKIRNPPSLMKKLGVKPGCRYRISGAAPRSFEDDLKAAGAIESARKLDLAFAFAESQADLANVWAVANTVWVIYPKGRKDFSEAHVRDQGREMGMMDTKVASFSAVLTAQRFSRVIRSV